MHMVSQLLLLSHKFTVQSLNLQAQFPSLLIPCVGCCPALTGRHGAASLCPYGARNSIGPWGKAMVNAKDETGREWDGIRCEVFVNAKEAN